MKARVTVSDAALRLRQGYWATRDLLLRGELCGGRDDRGRLYVEADSVERLLRQRARQRTARVPA